MCRQKLTMLMFICRLCFFTTSDSKSTKKFLSVLNESCSGALMCQLADSELNKHIMNMTTAFCRAKQSTVQKYEYVKTAAECLGRQPDSKVWVMAHDTQIDEDGEFIPVDQQQYIWLGDIIGNRVIKNVANPGDAAIVNRESDPETVFDESLKALKKAINNNYVPGFMLLGSAVMGMHYENIQSVYGMCPTPIAVGPKNTGKSTVARYFLASCGTPQFFVRDFTATAPSHLNSRKTIPTVFDDPDDIGKLKTLIDDTFNKGNRCTSKNESSPRTLGIITINLDRLPKLCSNYK